MKYHSINAHRNSFIPESQYLASNKNKDVKLFGILRDDAEWIKSQTEYVAERISSSKRSSKNSKRSSKGGSRYNSYVLSKNGSKTSGSKNKLFYYK